MALQDILEKIKKETEEKISAINAEFDEKIAKIEAESNEKRTQIEMGMRKKVTININKLKEKTEMLANMEARNALLTAKRKLMEAVIEEAIEKIISSSDYTGYIVTLLKKAGKDFKEGAINFPHGKKEETEAALKESGTPFTLGKEDKSIRGGFVLVTPKMESNNSLADIIKKQLIDTIESDIAHHLF